jgi:hypothetical protein
MQGRLRTAARSDAMTLHKSTFEYHQPTPDQINTMGFCCNAAADYAAVLEMHIPDGPDKTYILRQLRTLAMWVNAAITRHPDGVPR